MRLYRQLSSVAGAPVAGRVVAIGAFDGLHLGHREILERTMQIAADRQARSTVFSFEPMPSEFFARDKPPARLTCLRERVELLGAFGIDELCAPQFSAVRRLAPDEFVRELLVERLGAAEVVVGHDFRFGAGRVGSIEDLVRAGRQHGFGVTTVEPVYLDGIRISSTAIREALARGDLAAARRMLGRDYSMSGRVVHGLGLGKNLGFPTANVNLKRRLAPVDGIFAVRVAGLDSDRALDGVASVGSRPTVGGGHTLLEVFIFDFDRDIYGQYITVSFIERLRAEQKFDDLEAMTQQMHADVREAQAALRRRIA